MTDTIPIHLIASFTAGLPARRCTQFTGLAAGAGSLSFLPGSANRNAARYCAAPCACDQRCIDGSAKAKRKANAPSTQKAAWMP